jgi:hypothetical protein
VVGTRCSSDGLTLAIPWLYPAEINSIGMRTKGAALASASDWLFNYFVVQLTPLGIHNLRSKFYLIFFGFNLAFAPLGKRIRFVNVLTTSLSVLP